MKILFVCLGNICRSPMAEYIAKDYVKKNNLNNIEIKSRGTASYHEGEFMHKGTHTILEKYNIDHLDFKSKQITKNDYIESDFIFVMDDSNYDEIISRFGYNEKVIKITNFCTLGYSYVPDP